MARGLPIQQSPYFAEKSSNEIIGIVIDEPVYSEWSIRFPIEVRYIVQGDKISPATGQIMVRVVELNPSLDLNLSYGDQIMFPNKTEEIRPAYNPKQFDYKRYLAHKNFFHQANVPVASVHLLERGQGNDLIATALSVRKYFVSKFGQFITDRETLEICSALIFGYRANFQEETLTAFINTGTVHVLSVSGLHVGLVFFLLNFLLSFLDRFAYGRTIRFLLILLAIWGYVLLTGMAPSILRAGVMITFLLVAGWSQRSNQNVNSLFASAFCLLLFDPFMIFDIGFQLSYLAVLGLFTMYPLLYQTFPVRNKWLRLVWQAMLVSISAQIFTTPLSLYYFHQFPNYFLLGNLFVSLPTTVLMYAGIMLALCPFLVINNFLAVCLTYISRFLVSGLKAIEHLPLALVQGVDLSLNQVFCSMLVVVFILISWKGLSRMFLWLTMITTTILLLSSTLTSWQYASYQGVKFYNVGQHVAVAVINRGRVSILSTLDSLNHQRMRTHVLPDLYHYARAADMSFHHLNLKYAQHIHVQSSMVNITVIQKDLCSPMDLQCDVLLLRKISITRIHEILERLDRNVVLILDDSNTADSLAHLIKKSEDLGLRYYILKDNFAYVWTKK